MSLTHRTRVFLRDPVGSLVRRAEYLWTSRRARRFLTREPHLTAFLAKRPPDALPPDYADLWFLHQTARRRRPRCILEFGSGCSTLVLASALKVNHESGGSRGRLISLDSNPFWAEQTRLAMPESLKPYFEVRYTPALEVDENGTPAFRHQDVGALDPDMIYLDGPPLTAERRVAIDVLDLEERIRPGAILIVDGRWENVQFLRQHLTSNFQFHYRVLYQNAVFEFLPEDSKEDK